MTWENLLGGARVSGTGAQAGTMYLTRGNI